MSTLKGKRPGISTDQGRQDLVGRLRNPAAQLRIGGQLLGTKDDGLGGHGRIHDR
ncbi:hypothetical protein [Streptomyces sp. NBC_01238]|uniref:hypothetical protein n=1 Tax=Streptomyces sp. NBC_01238 TaxID=2903791 RepID=UPI003864C02B